MCGAGPNRSMVAARGLAALRAGGDGRSLGHPEVADSLASAVRPWTGRERTAGVERGRDMKTRVGTTLAGVCAFALALLTRYGPMTAKRRTAVRVASAAAGQEPVGPLALACYRRCGQW